MRQKVADYIADFLADNDIEDVFTVTGGGAMHLNDALGHHPHLHCTYNHNEQASAMAAEAYARVDNRIAAVCVTTGPGATNAITGVVGGWMDSIPMLILSGQARYATTVYASGLPLRTRGVQEFDIIGSVQNMTKYCELVKQPERIRYCLEKALYIAHEGRPGPCWLDIPLDVQGAIIETEGLEGYFPTVAGQKKGREEEIAGTFSSVNRQGKMNEEELTGNFSSIKRQEIKRGEKPAGNFSSITSPEKRTGRVTQAQIRDILDRLDKASRPVLFVGNGVRLAGAHKKMLKLVELLNVPVVTGMSSIDAMASDHRLYAGRNGTTGERAGNFAIQNCDLLLSLGSRLGYFQTGFNHESWAQGAYKILNDIDQAELDKDSLHADQKICCDAAELIDGLLAALKKPLEEKTDWTAQCQAWRKRYPVVLNRHREDPKPNIYAFYECLTGKMTGDDILVVGVGTSRVAGSQASIITEGMRFIANPSTASMGYDLPAAIGACVAAGRKKLYLVTGDGSFQMNIQELQTIVHNELPIAIFLMNNQGYHSIRMTQKNYFGEPLVGVGPESGDISFPDMEKIAYAYGIPFLRCEISGKMEEAIAWTMEQAGPCICEMMLSTEQVTEPKVASRKLPDGSMVSATLENMAPFLPEEELRENMYI